MTPAYSGWYGVSPQVEGYFHCLNEGIGHDNVFGDSQGGYLNPTDKATPMTEPETTAAIAKLLAGNYIERRDTIAVQFAGGYVPKRQKFTLADLVGHIDGKHSYGHYLISLENKCRMFCFDVDLNTSSRYHSVETNEDLTINPREVWAGPTTPCKRDLALQMRAMVDGLAIRSQKLFGCKVTVHYSGSKGMHVIGLLDPGTPAADAYEMPRLVLQSFEDMFECYQGNNFWRHRDGYPSLEIETFPKQSEVRSGDGLGNLLRLPLGIHAKSKRPSFFLDMTAEFGVFRPDDPLQALTLGSLR